MTDPDTEMVRYMQTQFEYGNIRLLTPNWQAGVEAYKKKHRIKDDSYDALICDPYQKQIC